MNHREMLERDINTLRESIRLNYADLGNGIVSSEDRNGILKSIAICNEELAQLIGRLASSE